MKEFLNVYLSRIISILFFSDLISDDHFSFVEESNNWLCGNDLTLADVSLGVLLHRLQQLGLEKHFWGNNKKPYLLRYFTRICQRKSFQAALPSKTATMKAAWAKLPYSYKVWAVSIPTVFVAILIYNK